MTSSYAYSPSRACMIASLLATRCASIDAYYLMNASNPMSNLASPNPPYNDDAAPSEVLTFPTPTSVGDDGGTNGHAIASVVPIDIFGANIGATIAAGAIIGASGDGGTYNIPSITTTSSMEPIILCI